MTFSLRRSMSLGAVAAVLTALLHVPVARAQSAFDGIWSVVIVTESGQCDRAYRYPISIKRGVVGHGAGVDQSFIIKGRVTSSGSVNVTISRGRQSAKGSGRLRGESGTGRWTSQNNCAGYWTAEKRPEDDS